MQLYRSAASLATHATMNAYATDSCERRTATLCTVPQQGSSPVQSTAWMERRRPALPEESSERARGVLCAKRIYSFSLSIHFEWGCSGGQTGAREHPELKRARYSLQTYRGRQLQTLGCIARAHVEYPLPQSSCSSRAARRKAPPTRAHK